MKTPASAVGLKRSVRTFRESGGGVLVLIADQLLEVGGDHGGVGPHAGAQLGVDDSSIPVDLEGADPGEAHVLFDALVPDCRGEGDRLTAEGGFLLEGPGHLAEELPGEGVLDDGGGGHLVEDGLARDVEEVEVARLLVEGAPGVVLAVDAVLDEHLFRGQLHVVS